MSNRISHSRTPRPHSLAACLAAVLGLTLTAVAGGAVSNNGGDQGGEHNARPYPPGPSGKFAGPRRVASNPHVPNAHVVTNCDDDINNPSPGSLRTQVAAAAPGETVDLSTLTCSTITLSAPIPISQSSLYLFGPSDRTLTIDGDKGGNGVDRRVFAHTGNGELGIYDLSITNGESVAGLVSNGGCIYSAGSVYLFKTSVSNCTLTQTTGTTAKGGGVYTKGDLTIVDGTVTGNEAKTDDGPAFGGGACVGGTFAAYYSTISDNTAGVSNPTSWGWGGGIYASHAVVMVATTISGNTADAAGGVWIKTGGNIASSTISGNLAEHRAGGIVAVGGIALANSTVAFNKQVGSLPYSGGIFFETSLDLESSIVADNVMNNIQEDVEGASAIGGSHNLITATTLDVPVNTKTSCPKLQSLENTGGPTKTLAPMASSDAIDNGYASPGVLLDQRQLSRFQGASPDIGSVEHQVGEKDDRLSVNGFDGLCDQ